MANTIVSSTTISQPSGSARQAHVIYAANSARWWAFYLSSTTVLATLYSTDGITWTAGATLTLSVAASEGGDFGVAYANISSTDVVHISYGPAAAGSGNYYHTRATISSTTITFGSTVTTANPASAGTSGFDVGVGISSTGKIAEATLAAGDAYELVWPNTDAGTSWTAGTPAQTGVLTSNANSVFSTAIAPVGTTSFLSVYDDGATLTAYGAAAYVLHYSKYNGTSWGADATVGVTSVNEHINAWGMCHLSDSDIHLVHRTGTNTYEHKRFNGTSWSAGSSITTQTSLDSGGCVLASDGTTVWLFVIDSAAGNNVKYCSWTSAGGWTAWSTLESTSATRNYLGVAPQQGSNKWLVYWTDGTASPWAIKCALLSTATNTSLTTDTRAKFISAAVLKEQTRSKFFTRTGLTGQTRAKFLIRMVLSEQTRAKFITAMRLTEQTRDKFIIAMRLTEQWRDKFLTRAGLTEQTRAKFSIRTALLTATRDTFKILAAGTKALTTQARAKFVSRMVLAGRTRSKFAIRFSQSVQSRSRFAVRFALAAQSRSKFYTRVALRTLTRSRFLSRIVAQVQTRARFISRAALTARTQATFVLHNLNKSKPLLLSTYSAVAKLAASAATQLAKLTGTWGGAVAKLTATGGGIVVTPQSTITSSITVKDSTGTLITNLSALTMTVTFPDGTTTNLSLAPTPGGIVNSGAGVYTATYQTKMVGRNVELWNATAADGVTIAEFQTITPVTL